MCSDKNKQNLENSLQHKSLLLFAGKKVIVAKVKLCGKDIGNHDQLTSKHIS